MALILVMIITLLAASALAYQVFGRVREQERRSAGFAKAYSGVTSSGVLETAAAVAGNDVAANLAGMGGSNVLAGALDVGRVRESTRRRRLWHVFWLLFPLAAFMYYRIADGDMLRPGVPNLTEQQMQIFLPLGLIFVLCIVLVVPMMAMGKSPHVRYDPSEIPTTLDDVVGLGGVKDEVVKSLNLFLGYQTFRQVMGGNPRKGVLFEGPPGTGKTYMAKAMAREAGVPFLFVSATAFQSQYYGATGRKIRNYFKELRKAARDEGGAIGFIEEIDAIAGARSGMRSTPYDSANSYGASSFNSDPFGRQINRNTSEGISGVVNELLIQLQSFDAPTGGQRFTGWWIDKCNRFLPTHRRIQKKPAAPSNILVIAATNRAADLDPALLRPGRFDRSIHFDVPTRSGRREIIDYYLDRKAHIPELDKEERRDALAAMTFGYTPVMIEHLFDEALVWALRDGRAAMDWADVQQAKMTEEVGLKQPVEYTEDEKRTIATHEAGHATVAYLVGQNRKLEVLSIIKRRDALGLLAHSDAEERYTRTRSELLGMMKIAFGGMSAEELFFGESGTGPSGDLVHATRIAAQMVGSFGMAGSLVSYDAVEAGPITQGIVGKVLGNEEARNAVEKLLDQAKADVHKLLDDNRHLVMALRDELLAKEELVGDEIIDVLREAEARRRLVPSTE
jgi:ATP-dependent Zn protease